MSPHLLKTGDVLACYGTGLTSWLISWLTPRWRVWKRAPSHVAILALHPDPDEPEGEPRLYVHESTTLSKRKDALDGANRRGVQAHLYSDWVLGYRGRVDLHPLKVAMSRPADCIAYLLGVHARKVGYDVGRAIHSASPVVNTATGKALFCSELVGYALQAGGSIDSGVNCSELTPHDVINLPCVDRSRTLKGAA